MQLESVSCSHCLVNNLQYILISVAVRRLMRLCVSLSLSVCGVQEKVEEGQTVERQTTGWAHIYPQGI